MSEEDDTYSNWSFTFGEIYEISPLIDKHKLFQFYFVHNIEDDLLCAPSV